MSTTKDPIDQAVQKSNGLKEYGKGLVELGEMLQQDDTTLEEIVHKSYELGLIVEFRVAPDNEKSIDIPIQDGQIICCSLGDCGICPNCTQDPIEHEVKET